MQVNYNGTTYNLENQDFVAKGGEGTIYRKGNLAFKKFHSTNDLPTKSKVEYLQKLNHDSINIALGLDTPFLIYQWIEGQQFSDYFTNSFWQSWDLKKAVELAEQLRDTIAYAHEKRCVLVDLNAGNILVADNKPVLIDCEAWSLPGFEADYQTAKISPAIRDWREQNIGMLSDWFAFAILTFELFVGLHPYRAGRISGYSPKDWQKRMKDGQSAFKAPALPKNCRSLDNIPDSLRSWMANVFAGERSMPTEVKGLSGIIVLKQVSSIDEFKLVFLQEYDSNIVWHSWQNGIRIVKTKNELWVGNETVRGDLAVYNGKEVITITRVDNQLQLSDIEKIACEEWGVWNSKIFSKVGNSFYWYKTGHLGIGSYVAMEIKLPIYQYATKVFNGFAIVDALGSKMLVAESIFQLPQLNNHKILNGKRLSDNNFLIISEEKNKYIETIIYAKNYSLDIISQREVETIEILTASPRPDFFVQIDPEEVRLMHKNQVQTFEGSITADGIYSENGNTIVAVANKLYQLRKD